MPLVLGWILLACFPLVSQETASPAQDESSSSKSSTAPQQGGTVPAERASPAPGPQAGTQAQETGPARRQPTADPKQEAWTILDEAASSEKSGERAAAIRALGLLSGNARATRMAEKALKDENPEVRAAAALALGDMQSKSSVPALRAVLDDPEPAVALAAAQALSLLHDRAANDVYFEVLTGERKTGKGLIESQKSMLRDPKKLARIGIAEGIGFIPFGGLGWEAIKTLTKDDASPIRASAAKILADDPDPASMKALEDATGDKSWIVRAAALEALAKRGNPAALDSVELAMYDEKEVVKYTAAATYLHLAEIKDRPAITKPKRQQRKKRVPKTR